MKKLEGYRLEELKKVKKIVSQYGSLEELRNDLNITISTREKEQEKSMNVRFCGAQFFRIFDPWELKVIQANHITNLQELIDCDLSQLTGITDSVKASLEWVRTFYDFRPIEKRMKENKKK